MAKTVSDLCEITGLGERTVRRNIDLGVLPGIRVQSPNGKPGRYVITDEAFERFRRHNVWPAPEDVVRHEHVVSVGVADER